MRPNPSATPVPRIPWRDLAPMRRGDTISELLHPLPWLAGSLLLSQAGWWAAALPCSFMVFLTALRLNHEAIHGNLGMPRRGDRAVLHALSALMLGSNHAVAFNHLHHHATEMGPEDHEGRCGRLSLAGVLAYGPRYPVDMHRLAWRKGDAELRRRMAVDLALNLLVLGLAFGPLAGTALTYHVLAMLLAQCLTAFFAVWITHRGCAEEALTARTQRNRWVNALTYNMFFHLEHHHYPRVPVSRLPILAARLDAASPAFAAAARRVIPEPGGGPRPSAAARDRATVPICSP